MTFALRPGITLCETGGSIIFLDVDRNRYFGLAGQAEQSFRALAAAQRPSAADHAALLALVRQGVLVNCADAAPPCAWPAGPSPARSLLDVPGNATASAVVGAFAQLAASRLMLKTRPFGALLATLKRRKSMLRPARCEEMPILAGTAAAFRLTALVAGSLDLCLPRSLALAHRLLDQGVAADLVIGVRVRPFAAHCWVRHGSLLINESRDQVRNFTPILAI
ncbi:MAG TPA: lasso peptide biosynthesis B2 protein [Sphingomonadaceae bacterium]|nr:lasso peptide biosynthesis B2 protein [Sphingomonadaceae bacterium]